VTFNEDDEVDFEALSRLTEASDMERSLHPEKKDTELAEEIMIQAAPSIAAGLVKLALSDGNSRVRLSASQYLLDRVLGKSLGDGPTKQAAWDGILDAVTETVDR
jgi:hypothetical protein